MLSFSIQAIDTPIYDESFRLSREGLHVSGRCIPDMEMKLICDEETALVFRGGEDGSFEETASCVSGQEVYLVADHDGHYESRHVRLQHTLFKGQRNMGAPSGVPEFSAGALGIAALAVSMGIIILRK